MKKHKFTADELTDLRDGGDQDPVIKDALKRLGLPRVTRVSWPDMSSAQFVTSDSADEIPDSLNINFIR